MAEMVLYGQVVSGYHLTEWTVHCIVLVLNQKRRYNTKRTLVTLKCGRLWLVLFVPLDAKLHLTRMTEEDMGAMMLKLSRDTIVERFFV